MLSFDFFQGLLRISSQFLSVCNDFWCYEKITINISCWEGNWWLVFYLIETIIWIVLAHLTHLIIWITESSALHIVHKSAVLVVISITNRLIVVSLITVKILPWTVCVLHHRIFTSRLREWKSVSQQIVTFNNDVDLMITYKLLLIYFGPMS